jgi:small subunit ribosomal protein S16
MVKMRLTRIGSKKNAIYRVVAIDSRAPRDGRFLELLGFYNPNTEPVDLRLKSDRILHWLEKGAKPSETVRSLLKKEGILKIFQEGQAA